MPLGFPTYDPLGNRDRSAFKPANEATETLLHIFLVARDVGILVHLHELLEADGEPVRCKVLRKHIVVEILSLDKPLRQFVNKVLRGHVKPSTAGTAAVAAAYDHYKGVFTAFEARFRVLRDKLGAHREFLPFAVLETLWDALEDDMLIAVVWGAAAKLVEELIKAVTLEWEGVLDARPFARDEGSTGP